MEQAALLHQNDGIVYPSFVTNLSLSSFMTALYMKNLLNLVWFMENFVETLYAYIDLYT